MSRTDRIIAFPAFYRGGPCSSRFTPGFVAFRLRTRDTTRFKKGSIDLTSVQYLICDVADDDDVKFSIVQAKDLFAGMSASRRMENRHVVLCAGPDAWRDIGDLKSWSDEVDRAGLTDAMTASLAHIVVSPSVDGSPPSVEVTRAFDADAFRFVDAVAPFSIVPPRPAFCATAIPPGKYDGAKFSPESIGMAPVTAEQREKLAASRKRKSSDDREEERAPKRPAHGGEQPPALDMSLEELLGLTDSDADEDARRADDATLEELLAADEDDCALPPLPELPPGGSQRVEDLSDLDDIYADMHANS